MSLKDEVREFLISRRAHVTPEQAGLPDFGEERRVPGLRREEVAMLAGVSLDYYTRLERGNIRGASESVLNAIARALQLNDVEREHLFDLARTAPVKPAARTTEPAKRAVRTSVQRVLDNLAVPAVVFNPQQDLIASNFMGRALFSSHFEAEKPNLARFIFLDPRAKDYYVDWPLARRMTAAMLRFEAGRDPLNSDLTALIGELSTRSPQFRKRLGRPDRARTPHRPEGLPPPRSRPNRDHLRRVRAARRNGPVHLHLQRRRRLRVRRQVRPTRNLGSNPSIRHRADITAEHPPGENARVTSD